jgi:prepilin signal peptidase PulO-like enzyme (type II secretory pathway)
VTSAILSFGCVGVADSVLGLAAIRGAMAYGVPLRFSKPLAAAVLVLGCVLQIAIITRRTEFPVDLAATVALGAGVVCAATDAATGYVFDCVTLPSLAFILMLSICEHQFRTAFLGCSVGFCSLLLLYALSAGRGIGLGDVKLAGCLGAALGGRNTLIGLGLAFVAGGAYAAFLLLTGRARFGDTVRFAPYLTGGMIVAMFLGE